MEENFRTRSEVGSNVADIDIHVTFAGLAWPRGAPH